MVINWIIIIIGIVVFFIFALIITPKERGQTNRTIKAPRERLVRAV